MFKVSLRSVWVPLAILGVAATCAGQAALGSPRAESGGTALVADPPVLTSPDQAETAQSSTEPSAGLASTTTNADESVFEGAEPSAPLRRLLKRETTRAVAKAARRIIDAHAKDAVGTEIAFAADGERYVARIERHYHPPGGEKKPWGEHAGVSVFVARAWPDDVKSGATR